MCQSYWLTCLPPYLGPHVFHSPGTSLFLVSVYQNTPKSSFIAPPLSWDLSQFSIPRCDLLKPSGTLADRDASISYLLLQLLGYWSYSPPPQDFQACLPPNGAPPPQIFQLQLSPPWLLSEPAGGIVCFNDTWYYSNPFFCFGFFFSFSDRKIILYWNKSSPHFLHAILYCIMFSGMIVVFLCYWVCNL